MVTTALPAFFELLSGPVCYQVPTQNGESDFLMIHTYVALLFLVQLEKMTEVGAELSLDRSLSASTSQFAIQIARHLVSESEAVGEDTSTCIWLGTFWPSLSWFFLPLAVALG